MWTHDVIKDAPIRCGKIASIRNKDLAGFSLSKWRFGVKRPQLSCTGSSFLKTWKIFGLHPSGSDRIGVHTRGFTQPEPTSLVWSCQKSDGVYYRHKQNLCFACPRNLSWPLLHDLASDGIQSYAVGMKRQTMYLDTCTQMIVLFQTISHCFSYVGASYLNIWSSVPLGRWFVPVPLKTWLAKQESSRHLWGCSWVTFFFWWCLGPNNTSATQFDEERNDDLLGHVASIGQLSPSSTIRGQPAKELWKPHLDIKQSPAVENHEISQHQHHQNLH